MALRDPAAAPSREMTPFEIAWSVVQSSAYTEPRNDWISVSIARRHLAALLDQYRVLRAALIEIEGYPVGDDGFKDIAHAALEIGTARLPR
jgi:hypothetical protein